MGTSATTLLISDVEDPSPAMIANVAGNDVEEFEKTLSPEDRQQAAMMRASGWPTKDQVAADAASQAVGNNDSPPMGEQGSGDKADATTESEAPSPAALGLAAMAVATAAMAGVSAASWSDDDDDKKKSTKSGKRITKGLFKLIAVLLTIICALSPVNWNWKPPPVVNPPVPDPGLRLTLPSALVTWPEIRHIFRLTWDLRYQNSQMHTVLPHL
eukprot:GHVU01071044.1.p1 GENE.GHVU01071044.1~~GHVU01071044.1.p1  ORF type:complete len:243 (+),score=39.06 GHVU01071044.1:90-731(+)